MSKFYTLVLALLSVFGTQSIQAQNGPNLLGAKGTFSAPFITVDSNASPCLSDGSNTYNPAGNVGNKLMGCTATTGNTIPCSDYVYTDQAYGMEPEFTYSILKVMGDINGSNCMHAPIWKGADHTGDGGYFLAVNGAPNVGFSPVFYQIKHIPVCMGTQYEFSAWVISMVPGSGGTDDASPNISFVINGQEISNSGKIPYNNTGTWIKVGGTFTATTDFVDLQVINATSVANGNDLGLDDISFSVLQSNIVVTGADGGAPMGATCEGNNFIVDYTVTDVTHTNTWYKWQKSVDGGATFVDSSSGNQQAVYSGDSFTLPLTFTNVRASMNGYKYRLIVSTSQEGLSNPGCAYLNDYTLIVNSCGALPVTLNSFTGKYSNGVVTLNWQTSQEIYSDHFELFKSVDGQNFSAVANIKSAGFSSVTKNYSYQDKSPISAKYVYYRLKQVDADGKFTFSSIVKLAIGLNTSISVYPNPFNNNFTVSFSATKTAQATLKLQTSTGQLVFLKTITVNDGNNAILINNLPSLIPGIYYMSVVNEELNFNSKLQKL